MVGEKPRKEPEVIKKSADEASEFAESVINTVREPLIALDQDLRVVSVSRSFYEYFKVKPEETVGQLIYDLGNKQWDIPKLRELLETILPQKTSFDNYEVEHNFAGIGKRIMLLNARQVQRVLGKEQIILLAIEDITERKREEVLRESEERYKALFSEALDALCLADAETGNIVDCNQALAVMVGRDKAELIGQHQAILHPSTRDKASISPTFRRHLADKEEQVLETQIVTKTGETREVEIKTNMLNLRGVKMLQGRFHDITVRKRAEEALRESERVLRENEHALREQNDELVRFNYAVSHDLKSPLVTIQTFLGYLEQDVRKPDTAGVDKDLKYIRTASHKMSRLLDELLELSRVGRKMNPSVEAPLQAIVKEALDLVAGRIAKRGVKVKVTKKPILLFGDRPRLVEIFQNLVDNAVKFMGDQPAPIMEIGAEQADGEIVLFVRDNGMGIDSRHQPNIFGLFEKLDPRSEGTGIGLALVKRILEVHRGKIWVESDGPGQGATFRFTLAKTRRL